MFGVLKYGQICPPNTLTPCQGLHRKADEDLLIIGYSCIHLHCKRTTPQGLRVNPGDGIDK
mgnify:CR=1